MGQKASALGLEGLPCKKKPIFGAVRICVLKGKIISNSNARLRNVLNMQKEKMQKEVLKQNGKTKGIGSSLGRPAVSKKAQFFFYIFFTWRREDLRVFCKTHSFF